jgi:hypothetical protein
LQTTVPSPSQSNARTSRDWRLSAAQGSCSVLWWSVRERRSVRPPAEPGARTSQNRWVPYRQHREAPAFRPQPSRVHGHDREDSYGGRLNPAAKEHGPNVNGGYQQTEPPRHHWTPACLRTGPALGTSQVTWPSPTTTSIGAPTRGTKAVAGAVRNHRPYGEAHQK